MIDPDKIPDHVWKRMNITREEFVAIQERQAEREKDLPPVGGEAPDFHLRRLTEDGKATEERVRLSGFRGRPVALVFGSYT
jgi:hypothetical protein